ncbi:MAG: class I SAM-dependent methyltransferase [Thermodesulfovibrionales bacterium]
MNTNSKEVIKGILRTMRVYRPAVYVYCRLETLSVKGRDILQFLWSPFPNGVFKKRGISDGLPFPPIRLVHLVTNTYSYEWFYATGVKGAQCIRDIVKRNGFRMEAFRSILDFGCGCGRVIRHWKGLAAHLSGSDYNPVLIDWCRENLSFAEFTTNTPEAMLPYDDEKFDFIYAISVFTHLTEESGKFWIGELTRVLKPGGVMYLTFMGTTRVTHLPSELREQFGAGQLVVTGQEYEMCNECAAYHPEAYVRKYLSGGLKIVDFVPGGARDANQDVFLFQKGSPD